MLAHVLGAERADAAFAEAGWDPRDPLDVFGESLEGPLSPVGVEEGTGLASLEQRSCRVSAGRFGVPAAQLESFSLGVVFFGDPISGCLHISERELFVRTSPMAEASTRSFLVSVSLPALPAPSPEGTTARMERREVDMEEEASCTPQPAGWLALAFSERGGTLRRREERQKKNCSDRGAG